MTVADGIVLAVFVLLLPLMAARVGRSLQREEEYFTGGQRTNLFQLVFFMFGSGTATDSTSTVMSGVWRAGIAGVWWQLVWVLVTPVFWVLAPMLRRLRAITTAEFFSIRFGTSTSVLYSLYGMAICVVLMAGVLYGSSRLLNTLTDPLFDNVADRLQLQFPVLSPQTAFMGPGYGQQPLLFFRPLKGDALAGIFLSILLVGCGLLGGLRAGILIDCVQGVLRVGLTLVLLPLVIWQAGGFGAVHRSAGLKTGMLDFVASSDAGLDRLSEPFTPFYLLMLSIAGLCGIIVQPHIMVLCGAGRRERDARLGFTLGNLLKRVLGILWAFLALGCVVWYLGPNSPLQQPGAPVEDVQLLQDLRQAANGDLQAFSAQEVYRLNKENSQFADRLFGRALRDLLDGMPPGLVGLVAAMVVAAAVSHCGTQMVVGSGLFSAHLCRFYLMPEREPRELVNVGRVCGVVLVAAALILQMSFRNITDIPILFIKTTSIIGVSMWMGLLWTRWNTVSVWAATIAGATMGVLCGYLPHEVERLIPSLAEQMFVETPNGRVILDSWKILLILSSTVTAGVVATLVTEMSQDDQLEFFYRVMRTKVRPGEVAADITKFEIRDDDELVPCISMFGFQFPGATREGTLGFVLAWVSVVVLILGTRLLLFVI
ncbi:MAG: hypothetical protein ACK5TG_04930 [Planctomyces sp.]|jgi:Na+/proline symporter